MAKFSKTSNKRLLTCEEDLIILFKEVIKYFDCTILYGYRSIEEQRKLYKIGREEFNGKWHIVGSVVTYMDGIFKKSDHNYTISRAVDVVPYPVEWKNTNRMLYFIGFVLGTAQQLKNSGIIKHEIISGVDWDKDTFLKDTRFLDFPHFKIVK